jgi:hypothetical protein
MEIEKVNSSKPLKFTHDLLDFDLGRKLGIRNVRKQILEGHSKNVFGKSFGQRENISKSAISVWYFNISYQLL